MTMTLVAVRSVSVHKQFGFRLQHGVRLFHTLIPLRLADQVRH